VTETHRVILNQFTGMSKLFGKVSGHSELFDVGGAQ
jgi:hypothetical protein